LFSTPAVIAWTLSSLASWDRIRAVQRQASRLEGSQDNDPGVHPDAFGLNVRENTQSYIRASSRCLQRVKTQRTQREQI
jgi:hypothetical protein